MVVAIAGLVAYLWIMSDEAKIDRAQALSGIRVLTHLVRADGRISDKERHALTPCLQAMGLDGSEIDAFLAEELPLADTLNAVTHAKLRRAVMRAAHAVARADGVRPEEPSVIEAVRRAWGADVEDEKLARDVERLAHEEEIPTFVDPKQQAEHMSRLIASWTLAVADLALSNDQIEARWRGRPTDISELTRRLIRGEATVHEVSFKIMEDIGEK